MAMLDDIGALLVANGLGTLGTNLFLSLLPANVADASVVITETGGSGPGYVHETAQASTESPSFQVIVRDNDYGNARSKADSIWKLLSRQRNTLLSGSKYLSIRPIQSPFPLGKDENERLQIIANYAVVKEVT